MHLTEIKGGKKIEKHLCEQCAAQNEGLAGQRATCRSTRGCADQLCDGLHSGLQKETGSGCDTCGITCRPNSARTGCWDVPTIMRFLRRMLTPLLQRAHERRHAPRRQSSRTTRRHGRRADQTPGRSQPNGSARRSFRRPSRPRTTSEPPSCATRSPAGGKLLRNCRFAIAD